MNIYFLPSKLYGFSKSRFLAPNQLKVKWSYHKFCVFIWWWFVKNWAWFSRKVVQKLKLSINHFHKKSATKQLFFDEKKSEKFRQFLTYKIHLESLKFLALFDHLSLDWDKKFGHGLRTPREEIAFTARLKIQFQSQIFRYGQSIFCLPHRPNFSDIFDLYYAFIGCP